jgi:hypothetical protein
MARARRYLGSFFKDGGNPPMLTLKVIVDPCVVPIGVGVHLESSIAACEKVLTEAAGTKPRIVTPWPEYLVPLLHRPVGAEAKHPGTPRHGSCRSSQSWRWPASCRRRGSGGPCGALLSKTMDQKETAAYTAGIMLSESLTQEKNHKPWRWNDL